MPTSRKRTFQQFVAQQGTDTVATMTPPRKVHKRNEDYNDERIAIRLMERRNAAIHAPVEIA